MFSWKFSSIFGHRKPESESASESASRFGSDPTYNAGYGSASKPLRIRNTVFWVDLTLAKSNYLGGSVFRFLRNVNTFA